MTDVKMKIINAGNCLLCKKPINLVDCDSGVANIFFCKECNSRIIDYNHRKIGISEIRRNKE